MKCKINFKQTRATSAGDINSLKLLIGLALFVTIRKQQGIAFNRSLVYMMNINQAKIEIIV